MFRVSLPTWRFSLHGNLRVQAGFFTKRAVGSGGGVIKLQSHQEL